MMELTSETFATAIQGELPLVVDFWAEWCFPCKLFAPIMEELADELDGKAEFAKVNLDECGDLGEEYGITHIPTLLVFKNGELEDRAVGNMQKEQVLELINKHI